jgi:hypothetical protein
MSTDSVRPEARSGEESTVEQLLREDRDVLEELADEGVTLAAAALEVAESDEDTADEQADQEAQADTADGQEAHEDQERTADGPENEEVPTDD